MPFSFSAPKSLLYLILVTLNGGSYVSEFLESLQFNKLRSYDIFPIKKSFNIGNDEINQQTYRLKEEVLEIN